MEPIAAPITSCLIALALSACTPMSQEQVEEPADSAVRSDTGPTNEAGRTHSMDPMLAQIRADAAQRIGVAVDQVKVLTVESVTWSDGSLGCPEQGMMYTQALARGHRVRVDAGGTILVYHAGAQQTFVQCPPDRAKEPSAIDST
jgi:hypothetical protein